MKPYLYFLILILIMILIWYIVFGLLKQTDIQTVYIEDKAEFSIESSVNMMAQAKGLSGRDRLPKDHGMLFMYKKPAVRHFWMRKMNFPLDFIWIRSETIVGLDEHIPHPAENGGKIHRLSSPEPADMVLEINAGLIDAYGIAIGDRIKIE